MPHHSTIKATGKAHFGSAHNDKTRLLFPANIIAVHCIDYLCIDAHEQLELIMYKNMKIEINEKQPLDEIVRELERIGYWLRISGNMVFAWMGHGKQNILRMDKVPMGHYQSTTLAELEEQPNAAD